ncbi:MAG: DUF177 domain-containing protein [Erysipelotrichaceae bacterium]|nr:DUF177 domain-containing protein [Erysipelotrichaceae bacterium]
MKLLISDIKRQKRTETYNFSIDFAKEKYAHVFSLNKINKVDVEANVSDFGELIQIELHVTTKLILQCSYTLEDVDYPLDFHETLEFSENPMGEDILELPNYEIDLDEYVLSLIVAHVPLRVIKKGAKLPIVKGVKVISQDEFEEENKNKLDSRLSALDNWEE